MATSTPTTAEQICDHYGLTYEEFAALPTVERALYRSAYAADVLHVVEGAAYNASTGEFTPGPPYNNVGPDVCRYLEAVGADPGEPWCAADGSTMLLDSGVPRSALPELAASCHGWKDFAQDKGAWKMVPQRGFAGIIIESPTAGHFTLITDVEGDTVRTLEGNTNDDGSREGYMHTRKVRPVGEFAGFVDLPSLFN